jgi:hypothetical protein
MAKYYSVEEARGIDGLRLVTTAYMPGLWSEAAKNLLDAKKIPYVLVEQVVGGDNKALKEWTAQTSGPVAIWNDERPRSSWLEQLYLAESLVPSPALIPSVLEDRLLMFGLCNELCSQGGFAWNLRMTAFHRTLNDPNASETALHVTRNIAPKYGYDPALLDHAQAQMTGILTRLRVQLGEKRYLIGNKLSALDLYWAAMAGAIDPLPEELCPNMSEDMRRSYTDPKLQEIAGDALLRHRDYIYKTYLKLPMDF